jgi:hypothetical protein
VRDCNENYLKRKQSGRKVNKVSRKASGDHCWLALHFTSLKERDFYFSASSMFQKLSHQAQV